MSWQVADHFHISIAEIRSKWTLVDVIDAMLYMQLTSSIQAVAREFLMPS